MNDCRQIIDDNSTSSLRAAIAKSDITTNEVGIKINDPLYAKVLILDDGETKLVTIAMDAVAIGDIWDIKDDFLIKLRNRIEIELGIPGSNVLVNASHTHIPSRMLCDEEKQLSRTFDAVNRALQNMTPVKIGVGTGYEDRFMINRDLRLKNGKHWTIRHAHPCPPDNEVDTLGPVDPEIGIIKIDKLDGQPLAVVFNFACHPLLGVPGGAITANYPGFASKVIEDSLGDNAMALFLQGAGGDITEVLYKDVNRPRDSEPVGIMLGLSVLEALKNIETKDTKLNIITEKTEFPRRTDIPKRIESLLDEQNELLYTLKLTSLSFKTFLPLYLKYALNPDYPSDYSYRYLQEEMIKSNDLLAMDSVNKANIEKYLKNIYVMEKLARIQDDISTLKFHYNLNEKADFAPIPAEIMGIKINDSIIITAPVEMLVEIGLKIKKSSPYKHTFISAYSNGYMHYGSPATHYDKCGYEVTECFLAPEWQEIYEKKVNEIINKL